MMYIVGNLGMLECQFPAVGPARRIVMPVYEGMRRVSGVEMEEADGERSHDRVAAPLHAGTVRHDSQRVCAAAASPAARLG